MLGFAAVFGGGCCYCCWVFVFWLVGWLVGCCWGVWHWNCSRCIGEGDDCRGAPLAGDESTLIGIGVTGVEGRGGREEKEGLISVERKMNCCCYGCCSFKVR